MDAVLFVTKAMFYLYAVLNITSGLDFSKMMPHPESSVRLANGYIMFKAVSLVNCLSQCHTDARCFAVSYNGRFRYCELIKKSGLGTKFKSTTQQGWKTYNLAAGPCPTSWYGYLRNCYLFERTRMAWLDASESCSTKGGHLLKIETEDENYYIKGKLEEFEIGEGDYFWTAGNDRKIEGVYTWNEGTGEEGGQEIVYGDWHPTEPNDYRGKEDCVALFPPMDYGWNDFPCDMKMFYICEFTPK